MCVCVCIKIQKHGQRTQSRKTLSNDRTVKWSTHTHAELAVAIRMKNLIRKNRKKWKREGDGKIFKDLFIWKRVHRAGFEWKFFLSKLFIVYFLNNNTHH